MCYHAANCISDRSEIDPELKSTCILIFFPTGLNFSLVTCNRPLIEQPNTSNDTEINEIENTFQLPPSSLSPQSSNNDNTMDPEMHNLMLTNFNIDTDTDDASSVEPVDDERNDSEELEKDCVRYYEWARGDDKKLMKMIPSNSAENSIGLLDTTIQVLKWHLYVKRVQHKFYDDFKKNLGKNDLLVHIDYSESYENKQQREIQSAYFGQTTFSIFTACCYLHNNEDLRVCDYHKRVTRPFQRCSNHMCFKGD